jgi:murein hydrolase activator
MQLFCYFRFLQTTTVMMIKRTLIYFFILFAATTTKAQTRAELEKQRQELQKEINATEKQQTVNKEKTTKSLTGLIILSNKANLQERVVDNFSKDLNILENNIVGIQRDVNKYDRLLDTLRQEYAKSMVYAYKNRGNYEFLNFIFSANNFNDAIKRMAYLKSYRTYREMQGENIMRTQDLRRKRLEDLGVTKKTKSSALEVQTVEMKKLEEQKLEQDRIVEQLKREGKDINARIAEKRRQVARVDALVKKAIAKAIAEAAAKKKAAEAIAKKKREDARLAAAAESKRLKAAQDKIDRENKNKGKTSTEPLTTKTTTAEPKVPKAPKAAIEVPENRDFNTDAVVLGSSFPKNKGSLPWPVDNGALLSRFGRQLLHDNIWIDNTSITISAPIGTPVKSVFDGVVILATEVDNGKYTVVIEHGKYYTTYSNMTNLTVSLGSEVRTGTVIGKVAANLDGIGSVDFYTANETTNFDPEKWLRARR